MGRRETAVALIAQNFEIDAKDSRVWKQIQFICGAVGHQTKAAENLHFFASMGVCSTDVVPLHAMAEVGIVSISIRETAVTGDVADETHAAWTLELVGVSGKICTVISRTFRK
jgi:hypothetical protein